MKQLLLLSAVSAGFGVTAQNFNAADTLQPGMNTLYYVMDSNAVNLDAVTGTGVTWNYATTYGVIGVTPNTDMIQLASAGANAADFPMAEYNDDLATFASVYFSNSADSTTVHGYVFTVDAYAVIMKHDGDPLKALTYPANVGTNYSDNTSGSVDVNGGMATGVTTGTANISVDGYGTLIVGGETINNVLRVKLVENISTSITVFPFPPDNGTVTRTIYAYYDLANGKQPIFQHATIAITSTLINDSFTAVYFNMEPAYASLAEPNAEHFSVYPNPANEMVTITTSGSASQLNIFTLNGKLVTAYLNPKTVETIDVSALPSGSYLVQVVENGQAVEQKIVVE